MPRIRGRPAESSDGLELLLAEQLDYYRAVARTWLGWDITVRSTSGPFYWGTGTRPADS